MKASDVMDKEAFITEKLKKFKLVDIREQYVDLIAEAKIDKLGFEDFLIKLLKAEDEGKIRRRTEKLIAKANFDTITSLSEIDYSFNRSLDKVEDSIEETLTFMDFPSQHWTRIRTNNTLERLNREIKRRTKAIGAFPDGNSALMLVCARLRHAAGTNWGLKRYMNMEHLLKMDVEEDLRLTR